MSAKNAQLEKFNTEYQRLNPRQKEAVDQIEGPVMVIAGPGTGKTQILSARIGKILLETDTLPQHILCLTYTEAGVIAMRKRIQEFIGADAYKVHIATFHGFCNEVIQDNLDLFEKNFLDPVSDLQRIELFKKLIDQFPKNHPLKRYRGDVYYEIGNLQKLFSTMKREGWTPEFIRSHIDSYLTSLPERDEFVAKRATGKFKKGDLRTDKIEQVAERMEKLRAAAGEFEHYQELMKQHHVYDFDDMINWVISAFENKPELLLRYQEQFLYILVDEFQDTSGTQNRLVQLLINYWDKPNVFVVGDDDQSIFRFQGANVENMLAFADTYSEDLRTVVLTDNYRSIQPILDVSMSLIEKNKGRLVGRDHLQLDKKLVSSNEQINQLTHLPVLHQYRMRRQEMIGITMEVQRILGTGVDPRKIGIIYKENRFGEDLSQFLKLRQIPYFTKRNLNILQVPFTRKILQLLRYLSLEHDTPYGGDELLFEILHYDFFQIPPIEIAKLSIEVSGKEYTPDKTSMRRLLNEKSRMPSRDLFTPALPQGMKMASEALETLIGEVPNVTLQGLFESLIRLCGILRYVMESEEKIWLLQVLTGLFDFIKSETRRDPDLDLHGLVRIFDLMKSENLSIPLVETSGNDQGVSLLTAHGSKGLEFEYVFLAGCNAHFWEKKRKPSEGYKFPDNLFSSVLSSPDEAGEEELRRLFYVALTRAEQYLYLSYSNASDDGKPLEPSMFLAEILEHHALKTQTTVIDPSVEAEFQILQIQNDFRPEIAPFEQGHISMLLEKFVMNVTALNNYLKCPLEFYFRNLVRIPTPKNEATEFGSSVHYALDQLFKKMQQNQQTFPPREELIRDFRFYMHRHRESFTREQYDRRLEYGEEVLGHYYDQYHDSWNKVVVTERMIRGVVVQGVPLKGKLDKLEFDGKQVNVVDYKTGDPEKAREKLNPPNDKNPLGGDYWRQAVFYKILIDHHHRDWNAVSSEFDFVEPDKKKQYHKNKVLIRPEDLTTVTQQIKTVWEKIQQHDFYTGCGKPDCHWCEFVKSNQMAISLHELIEDPQEEI
ncbi:MAG: ATP-dependent helicase [Bacteroidota bacterium]|nr:ATP-dependent helicase [Bacteroidota bacterium]